MDDLQTTLRGQTGRVLVVDDEEQNRELLRDLLEVQGHEVIEAENGKQALQKVTENLPDVVLLDVMMPELNGFEVCRKLKVDPKTAPIPVLLVTVLTDRSDRLTGIEAGANDFLSKPIDREDLRLRVRNAIYTKHLFNQVQESYERLRELETLRDNLTHMIIHDIRTPLTSISGSLELLQMRARHKLDEKEAGYVSLALSQTQILIEMASSLLDVSRLEESKMPLNLNQCDLGTVAKETLESLGSLITERTVYYNPTSNPVVVSCDANVIRRVIENLVGNALKFTPQDGEIKVTVETTPLPPFGKGETDGVQAKVAVADNGPGIPPEYHARIFEKFEQVETRQKGNKYSTGLGLTFCKLAVEAHGGKIGIDSEVGQGSTFWFTLPIQ